MKVFENTSPPQNHLGRARCHPYSRECTCLLRVLLAVQCPLQTSPITESRVCYITLQCHMHPIRYTAYTARSDSPTKKEICPFSDWKY